MSNVAYGKAFANNNKISQAEFDELYIASLDDPRYRSQVGDRRHFFLAALLADHGYSLDLRGLSLRNRNFRYADFSNIDLDGVDLGGSVCSYADFSGVSCLNVKADSNTKFYKAKLTDAQLLQLQAEPSTNLVRAVKQKEVELVDFSGSMELLDFA